MLSVLLIVALGVLKGRNLSTIDSDVWMPWIETQAWAPLQRLVAVTLFLAGAYLTFRVIGRHAAGRWRALPLTLIAVSIFSVRGSAAGFVLCALVLWACHEYVDGPGPVGSWLLTILTVAISASRGEFGVYVALAAGAALVARHVQDGARALGGAALRFIGAIAAVTLLWVPFGQVLASLHRPGLSVVDRTLNIRWAPGVNAAEREAKEREHALPDGQPVTNEPSGRTWNYRWTGQAPASVRKLLNDPAVEDTKNIDRTTARYEGIGVSPDDDSEWMTALPFGASRAVVTAGTAAWWLWVLLPIAAAVGVIRSAIRPVSTHPGSRADLIVLPAIMLCLPIARLVVQGAGDLGPVAAPAMPALAVLAAWLLTGPFLRQPSEASEAAATWQRATRVRETTTA
jgi:hypothetical protein